MEQNNKSNVLASNPKLVKECRNEVQGHPTPSKVFARNSSFRALFFSFLGKERETVLDAIDEKIRGNCFPVTNSSV